MIRIHTRWLITFLILLSTLLSGPAVGTTFAQDGEPTPTETPFIPQEEPTDPPAVPTDIPADTETPFPTATDIPATTEPEPTATSAPSEVPPTPTPTDEPTAISTPTPDPTLTPTTTPTPSPTATPTPTPPRFTPRSIVSGSGCIQTSSSDRVETTSYVNFSCEARNAPIFVYYSGTVSAPTSGWQYRINGGSWMTASSSLPTQGAIFYRSVLAFSIDLRPTTSVTPGSTGSVAISVACATGCTAETTGYATTLSATRLQPAPTAADLQLACTPSIVSGGPAQPQNVS
jgi:hypothetical protein